MRPKKLIESDLASSVSASARCRRSISASSAVRTSVAAGEHLGHLRRRSAARRRSARRARARRRSSARLRRPSSCRPGCRRSARPRASSMPTWRLRLRVPVQVSTRSPRPLRPASVSRRPPAAQASRVISARPRVISAASALCPSPSPSTTPAAIAMMFFSAPPISTPTTSSLPYSRKYGPRNSRLHELDRRGVAATRRGPRSAAAARPRRAKLGPDSTTTGCAAAGFLRDHLATCAAACRPRAPWSR